MSERAAAAAAVTVAATTDASKTRAATAVVAAETSLQVPSWLFSGPPCSRYNFFLTIIIIINYSFNFYLYRLDHPSLRRVYHVSRATVCCVCV